MKDITFEKYKERSCKRKCLKNNLAGLLVTKINIFLSNDAKRYQWKPSDKGIKCTTSVTYKNLTTRLKKKIDYSFIVGLR